jgi:triosephosphate isomerase (TIM)
MLYSKYMKIGHEALVIGNWKMHPQTDAMAKRLATELKKLLSHKDGVIAVVAPPSIFIPVVSDTRNSARTFSLGAQNVHKEPLGAFTGEVSLPMLKSYGVEYVILGHSERRAHGETDAEVQEKVSAVLKAGFTAVVCVGETKRDHGGHYLGAIERQIREALKGLSKAKLGHVVIAYEPVWAIGTGQTATPGDVHEMKIFIEKTLTDLYGRNYAQKVRVLYGGSVNGKNAGEIMKEGMVDGFLVGGASLIPKEFGLIVDAARTRE